FKEPESRTLKTERAPAVCVCVCCAANPDVMEFVWTSSSSSLDGSGLLLFFSSLFGIGVDFRELLFPWICEVKLQRAPTIRLKSQLGKIYYLGLLGFTVIFWT
ncbi:MAG: hypothetical protein ACRCW3_03750, partial [Metamycoplasmataceae bacterium]